MDAARVTVLSELGGIFALRDKEEVLKAFLGFALLQNGFGGG